MIAFLRENLGTILITLALAGAVTLIILSIRKDKKKGKSSCGGNCSHCAMCKACHQK